MAQAEAIGGDRGEAQGFRRRLRDLRASRGIPANDDALASADAAQLRHRHVPRGPPRRPSPALTGFARWPLTGLLAALTACAPAPDAPLADRLAHAAPSLSREVLDAAIEATACAQTRGEIDGHALAVIDYTRPSVLQRLWLLDLDTGDVRRMLVAHGEATGGLWAADFSNTPDSHQTSLGLFRGAEVYEGDHGRSLRLDGLEPGFNDAARAREIVVHGADYVSYSFILRNGRLGRSWGCPAVPTDEADAVVTALADGGALFAWGEAPGWHGGVCP